MSELTDAQKWRLFHAAGDTLGIYPQSIQGGEKPYEKRSDYMNGWNAAVSALFAAYYAIDKAQEQLQSEVVAKLQELIDADHVFWSCDDERHKASLAINVNDTFYWAGSDAEDLQVDDIEAVHDLWKRYGYHGIIAWVANRRNEEPLSSLRTDEFAAALAVIGSHPAKGEHEGN